MFFDVCMYNQLSENSSRFKFMEGFEGFISKAIKIKPDLDAAKLFAAYEYAEKINKDRYRLSGDPYIAHVTAVLDILLSLNPDEDTLIAAMLHGYAKSGRATKEEIGQKFGENVLFLVEAVQSLKAIKSRDENTEAESLRGMFVTMAKDLRVIMIKLADRLHNMQTIEFQPAAKQKQVARETMDIYVPISARLGIYSIKSRLEDLSFRTLYPRQYEHVKSDLDEYVQEKEKTIEYMKSLLSDYLASHNIEAQIDGRVKNLYSIYRKLKIKSQTTLHDLHDVLAMRVILPDKTGAGEGEENAHLYGVLGLIHGKWTPIAQRFKDYVAVPKPNGYQSLHTAVLGLSPNSSQATEIQLRTERMHTEAEYGVASHWIYDDRKKIDAKDKRNIYSVEALSRDVAPARKYVDWINAVSRINEDVKEGKDLIEALKIDVFTDRIFVMTPSGDVKDLPKGATPVDFAYSVHTDVGHRCQLAKVNGSVVSLDYALQNGEVVEIVTSNKIGPKSAWLAFVKTTHAKAKIRSYLRSLDKERSFKDGKELLNRFLAKMEKPPLDDDLSVLRNFGGNKLSMRERVALVEEVGNGAKLPAGVLRDVFGAEFSVRDRRERAETPKALKFTLPGRKKGDVRDDEIFIAGERGLPHKFAHCCKPRVGMPIVGYITRDHTVTIHLQKCKHLKNAHKERILEAKWGSEREKIYFPVKINLISKNRTGLIREIAEVITRLNVNVLSFSDPENKGEKVERSLVLEISDNEQLQDIMEKLNRIRNVLDVRRSD